ncbi:MAG: glycosyltransferase family 39 protein, partial [Candidatus Rokubacteria bacterium]|nr:glycosyltransferase family 39 protein [Candidatus Rokubacteria bacterium]
AAAGALATLLLVYRLGTDLFGARAGLLSALVLATSNLFFWYARQGHPDQFLTAFVTLACLGLWRGLGSGGARWAVVAYAAMALGVLSKGLLGLVLPLLAGATYLLATGPARRVPARLRPGLGLAVFLAVVLLWFGPAVAQNGPSYLYETLVRQHLVRYAATWAHSGAWYYYLGEFPAEFFPWVLFLPGAMVLGWRSGLGGAGGDAGSDGGPLQPFRFPLAWFASGFVFFSLSTSKRGAYLLPLYPAAALMVGWLWDRALAGPRRPGWVGVPLGLVSGAAALLAVGLAVTPRRLIPGRMVDTLVPADPASLAAFVALLLAGALAVWLPWHRGWPAATFGVLVGVLGALLLAVATVRGPQYEARFPVRDFAARVRAAVPPGLPLLSLLEDYNFIVAFYLERPIQPLPGLSELLAVRSPTEPRYALVDNDDGEVLEHRGVVPLEETRLGPKRVVLVRLDPLPR